MVRKVEGLVSLHRRFDGWWAHYYEDGKRVRRTLSTPHVADARLKAAEIETRLRRKSVGLGDAVSEQGIRPIEQHVADFETTMRARGGTSRHVAQVAKYLRAAVAFCGAKRIGDLDGAGAARWLEEARATNLSARTLNARRAALRAFTRWAVETHRVTFDPLVGLRAQNMEADRRRVRRALTAAEMLQLVEAARTRPLAEALARGYDLTDKGRALYVARGAHRALTYLVARGTGLRRGELTRVKWDDLDLGKGARVDVPAASAKSRVDQSVPLSGDVLAALVAARASRSGEPGSGLVFPPKWMPNARSVARDLKAAGIPERDDRGRVVDFHALRGSFVTGLVVAGVHPKVAQALARHSDVSLTLRAYSDVTLLDLKGAVEKGAVSPGVVPVRVPETCQQDAVSGRSESPRVGPAIPDGVGPEVAPEVENDALEAVSCGSEGGAGGGCRTPDLLFTKQLLYR